MTYKKGQYGYDLARLQKDVTTIELVAGNSRVVVVPELQGRVMTSTNAGGEGRSFGWINHKLTAPDECAPFFNSALGGEERFWLGPEEGRFSIFFEVGKPMTMKNRRVPAAIDTEKWDIEEVMPEMTTLSREFSLVNYSGTGFRVEAKRRVGIIFKEEAEEILKIHFGSTIRFVAYESLNQIKNIGDSAWKKASGLLSIRMLSRYNSSPETTIVIPYKQERRGIVNDDYFDKAPPSVLKNKEGVAFFRAGGKYRSKSGFSASLALPFVVSYDASNGVLTVLETSIHSNVRYFENSSWHDYQNNTSLGNGINACNGASGDHGNQPGSFYELESFSPALDPEPGEARFHIQRTYHFEGEEKDLDKITEKILKVSLNQIKKAFE